MARLSLMPKKELKISTFLTALVTAALCFLPFVIKDGGYFIFFGDFNVQQIPFYKACHEAVRSGNIFWSSTTDLGANFIGSYSFYLLGSPFFWLTLPFPTEAVPYLMAPLLALKIALAALTAYIYIRRFTDSPRAAQLGALLYAFSGFSVYNIFFNHFHEALIIFPLLLWAVEVFCAENRRGVLALTVCAAAVMNYFFFFGMVVFVIIYYIIRMFTGCWKFRFKNFIIMAFECVLGVAMAAILLLPSAAAVIGNSRITQFLTGWNAWLYGKTQIYGNILECFFFPPDLPARPVFFPGADVKWSSVAGWMPLFGMVGVFAWMQGKKGHWLRRVIGVMIFMAAVPVLNSAFYMFNSAYYARWFYMPILMMALATAMSVEDREVKWWSAYRWCLFITLAIAWITAFFPETDEQGNITLGLFTKSEDNTYLVRFAAAVGISLACLLILAVLIPLIKRKKRLFYNAAVPIVCVISIVYATFFIACGQSHSYNIKNVMINSLIEGEVDLHDNDGGYRVDTYACVDNTAMFYGLRSINAFHSIVPSSVTDFYNYLGVTRDVASRPSTELYAIRPLLSVKYVLNLEGEEDFETATGTRMKGYNYIGTQSSHKIYENENYIPMGFSYNYYMTESQASAFGKSYRSNMMLKALLLDKDQIAKYGGLMKNIGTDYNAANLLQGDDKKSIEFGYDAYSEDCRRLAANAADSFEYTNSGFISEINLQKDNLVFFSVPYDEGFSATVNGQPAEIERVNVGFMAVKCQKGHNEIVFKYKTPGLDLGIKISAGAVLIFIIYCITEILLRKNRPDMFAVIYPEGDRLAAKFESYRNADMIAADIGGEAEETDESGGKGDSMNDTPDDEYFRELGNDGTGDYYGGFEGGFTVDDTVLDEKDEKDK